MTNFNAMSKAELLAEYNRQAKAAGRPTRKQFGTKAQAIEALGRDAAVPEAFGDTVDDATRRKIRAADEGVVLDPRPPRVKVTKGGGAPVIVVDAAGKETRPKKRAGKGTPKPEKLAVVQPRPGTDRARVMELANGKKTRAEIGAELGKDAKWVSTVLVCMKRDYGTQFETDANGRVKITKARS